MKKSEILNTLTFEEASEIILNVFSSSISLRLQGTFRPIDAMRLIKQLPAKFTYSYTPIE